MGIGVVCDAGPGEGAAAPSSLRGATLEAFNHYLTSVEDFNARTLEQGPFLWIDGLNSRDRSDALAQLIQKNNLKGKVGAAGWDVGTPVVQGVQAGNLTFTIDQQAYLQGFDTIMQLYLFNISGGLMKPTNTDTGLGIVVKSTVGPYLAKNRFEGTSSKQQALTPPESIPH